MQVAVYSVHAFEKSYLQAACEGEHDLRWIESRLSLTTLELARGCNAVSLFVNDDASADVLEGLNALGVRFIALRSAGFNNVDLARADALGIQVANVPEYSPYAVAEHTMALILALNRKLIKAHNRIVDLNFSLDGLEGFDLHGKTVGVIGVGRIGEKMVKILAGFGCRILAYDVTRHEALCAAYGLNYVALDELFSQSDIITLHIPLLPQTRYLIDGAAIAKMKRGVMLINTSRGGLLNTRDVINALKSGQIGYLGLDVYEEEQGLFFEDHSAEDVLQDEVIGRLLTFKNVIITSHQAFLTREALTNIAATVRLNLDCFAGKGACPNRLTGGS